MIIITTIAVAITLTFILLDVLGISPVVENIDHDVDIFSDGYWNGFEGDDDNVFSPSYWEGFESSPMNIISNSASIACMANLS